MPPASSPAISRRKAFELCTLSFVLCSLSLAAKFNKVPSTKHQAPRTRMSNRSFASDNNAGVHPDMIEAIRAANEGHVVAYGDDPFTERAVNVFQKHFGKDIAVYFVFGGTGANVLGLKAITKSYEAVVCAETAHINVDECGAPEKFTG